MQQRYCGPGIGRFYSNDPVGFSADKAMMFNRYANANNNPYKFVDPDSTTQIYTLVPRSKLAEVYGKFHPSALSDQSIFQFTTIG